MTQRNQRIVLEYTPEDFYYLADAKHVPTKGSCADPHGKLSPYQKQLCVNRDAVSQLMQMKESHSGVSRQLFDQQSKYYNEVLKMMNLGIGILCLFSFLYYSLTAVQPPKS